MTDRMALLELVVEAAAAFHQAMLAPIGAQPEGYLTTARERLEEAFSALNSTPAEPVGVELWAVHLATIQADVDGPASLYVTMSDGSLWCKNCGSEEWHRVPLPTIPTVAARVEG